MRSILHACYLLLLTIVLVQVACWRNVAEERGAAIQNYEEVVANLVAVVTSRVNIQAFSTETGFAAYDQEAKETLRGLIPSLFEECKQRGLLDFEWSHGKIRAFLRERAIEQGDSSEVQLAALWQEYEGLAETVSNLRVYSMNPIEPPEPLISLNEAITGEPSEEWKDILKQMEDWEDIIRQMNESASALDEVGYERELMVRGATEEAELARLQELERRWKLACQEAVTLAEKWYNLQENL